MTNIYKGECSLNIHGTEYTLVYDWAALSVLKSKYTDSDLSDVATGQNLDIIADVIAIGLQKHHKGITAKDIMDLSPPLISTITTLGTALNISYYGAPEAPQEDKAEKKTKQSPKAKPTKKTK